MKTLIQSIQEKLVITKDTKEKSNKMLDTLEELSLKYNLKYTRISNCDRRYEIPDKLSKKFLKFMRQPRFEIDITLNKFIEDNNLLDTKKYNCHTIISGDNKSRTTYYYIVIYDKDKDQTVAQIIYRYNEEIRIYTWDYSYMKMFNHIFAQIIDYIFNYEKS